METEETWNISKSGIQQALWAQQQLRTSSDVPWASWPVRDEGRMTSNERNGYGQSTSKLLDACSTRPAAAIEHQESWANRCKGTFPWKPFWQAGYAESCLILYILPCCPCCSFALFSWFLSMFHALFGPPLAYQAGVSMQKAAECQMQAPTATMRRIFPFRDISTAENPLRVRTQDQTSRQRRLDQLNGYAVRWCALREAIEPFRFS